MRQRIEIKNSSSELQNNSTLINDDSAVREKSSEDEIDLFRLTGLILRHTRFIAGTVVVVMIFMAIVVFLLPNKYRSQASILPSGMAAKMAGLMNMSPVSMSSFAGDESSSVLFADILQSRRVKDDVLKKEYNINHNSRKMQISLSGYFGNDNPDKLRKALGKITSVATNLKTGIINVAVETKYPELSYTILNQYLAELDAFNLYKRRSRAKETAKYLERQLKEMELELQRAEDSLEQFQLVNRNWAASTDPEITKMLTRLRRNVQLRSKTYFFLHQEYQAAKLEAQKDVPIVRILDRPSIATTKSGPHRGIIIVVSGFVSLFMALFFVVSFEGLKKRSSGSDRESYLTLREDLQKTFPRVTRLVGKRTKEKAVNV